MCVAKVLMCVERAEKDRSGEVRRRREITRDEFHEGVVHGRLELVEVLTVASINISEIQVLIPSLSFF